MSGLISVVLNLDSRPGIDGGEGGQMGDGARSWDFMREGIANKLKFLPFDEVCCYVDEHLPIPKEIESYLRLMCHKLEIVPHDPLIKNDARYVAALRMATSDAVCHFDQDVFCAGDGANWIRPVLSGQYKFVSYPCASSPDPDPDRARWQNFRWCSTRAFFGRTADLRLDDLEHCLTDADWAWEKFGHPHSKHPWTEHFIGLMAGENQVFYPPLNDKYSIWSWSRYLPGVLPALNGMSHEEVRAYVQRCGGLSWSGELEAKPT